MSWWCWWQPILMRSAEIEYKTPTRVKVDSPTVPRWLVVHPCHRRAPFYYLVWMSLTSLYDELGIELKSQRLQATEQHESKCILAKR
ncbi:hypothetical protein GDO81_016943 [Engystomops pustulosus]|uniref:Uncharacterized protein n=1 Tax=Engystomops pustulosus TaxID=76066 RepID=A0AAV7A9M0_ENGPU|nr:hypothetical protein GDO81_016943 [Engystomops pustulosus]